jgi:molybdopterin synthase catalytic subunit
VAGKSPTGQGPGHDHGRAVSGIEYFGHPLAGSVLASVAAEVMAGTECDALAVTHRVGELAVGEFTGSPPEDC